MKNKTKPLLRTDDFKIDPLVDEVMYLPEDMDEVAKEYPFEADFIRKTQHDEDQRKAEDHKNGKLSNPVKPSSQISNYEFYLLEQSKKNLSFVADILGSKQKARDFRDGKVTLADLGALSPVVNPKRLSDI